MSGSEKDVIRNEPFKSDAANPKTISWGLGDAKADMIVHATGRETGLACSIAEHIWEPGDAGGLHIHLLEDEGFFVIEGEIVVSMPEDGVEFTVSAGELLWHPRGRKHDYRVTSNGRVRLIQILIPGTELVPGFFQAVADGKADSADTEEGAAEFVQWASDSYGMQSFGPEE